MLITYANHWAGTLNPIKGSPKIIFPKIFAFKFLPFKKDISSTASGTIKSHLLVCCHVCRRMHPLPRNPANPPTITDPREIPQQVHTGTLTWLANASAVVCFVFVLGEQRAGATRVSTAKRTKSGVQYRTFGSDSYFGLFIIHSRELGKIFPTYILKS